MMPITMAKAGECNIIKRVLGNSDTKRFLESLGFVVGAEVVIVTDISGNLIVNIKESRIAVDKHLANKIMI